MKTKLLAIHFETTTSNRDSLSSIGLALYIDDNVEYNEELKLNKYKDEKKSFEYILNKIINLIDEDTLVISQNATFDISVIRHFCDKYKLDYPNFDYMCTWKLGQILYGEEDELELEVKNPTQKTLECVAAYKEIMNKSDYKNIDELLSNYYISRGKLRHKEYKPFGINRIKNQLYRKNIVFTGGLASMRRADAFKIVKNLGALPSNSVSKNTDILVIGNQGIKRFNQRGKSSKMISVEKLQSQGVAIAIISEDDFLSMVNKN